MHHIDWLVRIDIGREVPQYSEWRDLLENPERPLNNKAIAETLFISENTVKNHIRNIHEKLQVHSRMEAVVRAVREGVLQIA